MESTSKERPRMTPMTGWHRAAGAKMVDFAGWEMPIEFPGGTVAEHRAVRSGCGIFDVSHMGTLRVSGPGSLECLNEILTNDLTRLEDNGVQYTLLCDEHGGVIDDMLVTRLGSRLLLVPNAANTASVASAIRSGIGSTFVTDESEATAIIAVQGPKSPAVLDQLQLPHDHPYLTARIADHSGVPVVVSRSGYTGEVGYELLVPESAALRMWEELLHVPLVSPAGLGARDTLRTEMGYPLHGHEISADIGPLQAGLQWAIAWNKPHFRGDHALRAQRDRGGDRRLLGVRVTGRGVPRPGMTLRVGSDEVGVLTSGTFSPTLGVGIGLGLVDRDLAEGTAVTIDVRGRSVPAELVQPPFVAASPR